MNVKEYVLVPRNIYKSLTQKPCIDDITDKKTENIDVNKLKPHDPDTDNSHKSEDNHTIKPDVIDNNKNITYTDSNNDHKITIANNIIQKKRLKDKHIANIRNSKLKKKKERNNFKNLDGLYVKKKKKIPHKYNWLSYN